jgi:hypothetical protein
MYTDLVLDTHNISRLMSALFEDEILERLLKCHVTWTDLAVVLHLIMAICERQLKGIVSWDLILNWAG